MHASYCCMPSWTLRLRRQCAECAKSLIAECPLWTVCGILGLRSDILILILGRGTELLWDDPISLHWWC